MSRRGAVPPGFLSLYADRDGGILFHFSGFASFAAALGAAVWARKSGEVIHAAITIMIQTTKRLDILAVLLGFLSFSNQSETVGHSILEHIVQTHSLASLSRHFA
jgi:hypothetical protein